MAACMLCSVRRALPRCSGSLAKFGVRDDVSILLESINDFMDKFKLSEQNMLQATIELSGTTPLPKQVSKRFLRFVND